MFYLYYEIFIGLKSEPEYYVDSHEGPGLFTFTRKRGSLNTTQMAHRIWEQNSEDGSVRYLKNKLTEDLIVDIEEFKIVKLSASEVSHDSFR